MPRTLLFAVLLLGLTDAAWAQAGRSRPCSHLSRRPGPIARAIERDAPGLAAEPGPADSAARQGHPDPAADWSRVTRLRPGTEIHLTTVSTAAARRQVVQADRGSLTVLDLAHPSLGPAAVEALAATARRQPAALIRARESGELVAGELRVAPDGVFLGGHRLVRPALILLTIPRGDVLRITRQRRRGSLFGAIAGGAAGTLAGLQTGAMFAMKPCGGSCNDEKALMAASMIGMPIGGALLGYHAKVETARLVTYDVLNFQPPTPNSQARSNPRLPRSNFRIGGRTLGVGS